MVLRIYLIIYDSDGYSITAIDLNGKELFREKPDLSEYMEYGISSVIVTDKEYIIFFSVPNSTLQHILPVVINRASLDVYAGFDGLVPGRCISNMPINGRYILFESQPDFCDYLNPSYSSDLCIYDMELRTFTFVDLKTDDDFIFRQLLSDENGNVVVNNVVKGGSEIVLYKDIISILA